VIHKGDLQVGLSYRYSNRDVRRIGVKKIANPDSLETTSQTATFGLNFGLSNNFSIAASFPVIRLERSAIGAKAVENGTSTIFGDLSLLPRVFLSPRLFGKPANLQIAIGASLPTSNGIFQAETNQRDFASGTIDPLFSATLAALVGGDANVFVSLYSRLTLAESGGREPGDLYSARIGLTRPIIGDKLRGTLRARWTHIQPDVVTDSLGSRSKLAGGDFYSISPGFSVMLLGSGEGALNGWFEIDIPVRQNVIGDQLTEQWSLSLGLTTGLNLFGHEEEPKPGIHLH
jgi:hypothetical protein